MQRLFEDFNGLQKHLSEERARYEQAVKAITGGGGDSGLVNVIQDVLGRFVSDIVQISQRSVRILMEVDALRGHADQVAMRGSRIEKIAQTTRVISLNARIEAQRVGTAGAVFRVVADEIKGLANESGELSKAIRDAIAKQAASLSETNKAASELASTDLNIALESHKRLEETIARLSAVSAASSDALERIQRDIDAAIQALQFEDMLDQLLAAVSNKLVAIQTACGALAAGEDAGSALENLDREVKRDAVTQHGVTAGAVELF
jgi:methyl-accepting chemotaxis protein